MADATVYPILSVCATIGSKLPDLSIKDGQLIFVKDKHKIALDYNGKRTFYNQIEEVATDEDRTAILAPVSGRYYFVIDKAILWTYNDGWIRVTTPPEEIVCIGTELPELGSNKTLYVNSASKMISIWDDESQDYITIAEKLEPMSIEDIDALFKSTN